ncbi:transglutaminase-like domain-containing protein [Paenibacillus sp. N4]|uniref:transglutaminase-like domain-containing protein n=1 Tax=Paenibacillus vietnamensis TaxID=2590547 RepID=UPI001CD0556A|nr:transglutaminase-like domain-containing protein [Paenibacillus vietnamensis]MCA0758368.1 transglutaminase-like domain-containing protein [Paenibacillus vietnamensis]
MRKWLLAVAAALIFFMPVNADEAHAVETAGWIDISEIDRGVLTVNYAVKAEVKTKLMVTKGQERYTYNLYSGRSWEHFPLQLGNGNYTVSLLENTEGNKYKVVKKQTVELNLKNGRDVFLNSVQNIAWTSSDSAIVKAADLTKNKKTDTEKAKAVYEYIISNIQYDNKLASQVPADYLPDIDRTIRTRKDICYGYASLFAAMMRSQGVPVKLTMGTSSYAKGYHAWNEAYLDGKWVTIDTTVDAGLMRSNKKYQFIKDASKYKANRLY